MSQKNMIIAIDDTDSREGMCTTYLCAALMDELKEYGEVIGSPILIRLNPTIPYKTRGNASTAFEIITEEPEKVMGHVISRVEELAELQSDMTNPGIEFVPDNGQATAGAFSVRWLPAEPCSTRAGITLTSTSHTVKGTSGEPRERWMRKV